MKLSEAIRLGAMASKQGFGENSIWGEERCALGAACLAMGVETPRAHEMYIALRMAYPWLSTHFLPPVNDAKVSRDAMQIVWSLNDLFNWTRERIADWVETVEPSEAPEVSEAVLTETLLQDCTRARPKRNCGTHGHAQPRRSLMYHIEDDQVILRMKISDKLSKWAEDDSVIFCGQGCRENETATCELCGSMIIALPESRAKAAIPGWHLVCKQCIPHLRSAGHELSFKGRYRTSEGAATILPPYQTEKP